MEHKLARGALRMDSRGNDAHHRDSLASTATLSVLLGALPPGAYDAGVEGQRKPRRQLLIPRTRHLLRGALAPVTEDWPLLRREGSGPSLGAFPFSSAENRWIGAIGARGSKDEEEEEEE